MQPHIPGVTLLEEVGRGRGGVVFRAIHRGNACTIKLPSDRPGGAGASGMFEQDVLQLARLSGAGLPRVWQLDASAEIPYAILDEPEGEPFVRVFGRATSEVERIRLALMLATNLKQLHDAGFVHGGLTDASVLVSGDGSRIVLRDLGSVTRPVPFDARVDLRAFGTLLCDCIAPLPRSPTASWSLLRLSHELALGSLTDLASAIAALEEHADLPHKRSTSYPPPSRESAAFASSTALARPSRAELSQLCRYWDAALASGAKVVEIVGAAGSGKSYLLAAFAEEVAGRDAQVLSVCSRYGDWAPFSTLKRMLDTHVAGLASLPAERREQLERALLEAAGPMASQIGLLSPRLAGLFRGPGLTLSRIDAQQVFVASLADFLARYLEAGKRSALVVDDIHWIDANSRTVLARVAARLCGQRGHVFVCAARDDADSREMLDRFRSALATNSVERLQLGPLRRADASKLVAEYLGIEAQPPRELVLQLSRLSDGTPLNMLELIRLALEGGHLRPRAGAWQLDPVPVQSMRLPASSLTLIERRLALLDDPAMELLRCAAVLRGDIDPQLLARSSGLSVERVRRALDSARSARLLEIDAEGRYCFVHDCIWEALQDSVPEQQRREIHQRAAELLSQMNGHAPDADYELARHYAAGVIERDPTRTFTATWRAAQRALEACDDMLALSLLKSAALAAATAGIDPGAEFYLALAETSLRTGAARESLLQFERALERSAWGFDRAHVLGRIAWVQYVESKTDLAWHNIEAALRQCGAPVPTDDPVGLSLAASRWLLGAVGVPAGSLQPKHAAALCGLYAQCLRISVDSGFPARGVASALLMSRVSRQVPPSRVVVQSELFMAFCFAVAGMDRASRKRAARAEAMALELADPVAQTLCYQINHVIAGWRGDIAECERLARVCVDERGHWMELGELCFVCFGMSLIESARGRPLRALDWTQRAIDRVAQHGSAPAVFALVKDIACTTLLGLGRDKAIAQLERQLRFVECADMKALGYYRVMGYSSQAQRLADRGELGDEFEALIEEFEGLGQNPKQVHLSVATYYLQVAHARVHQCLRAAPAQRAALLPKLRRALADLQAATRIEGLGSHTEVVRAAYEWFSGSTSRAEKSLARAEHLARQYGVAWASYAAARLRAHMLRAAGQEQDALDQARVAALWAQNYAQVSRLRFIQEEFELSDPLGEPARNEQEAAHARRQLHTLLRIGQANSRELAPDRQAQMILDELLGALGAARAFLFMRADDTGALVLRAARGRGGAPIDSAAEYDRKLVDQVYTTGQTHPAEGPLNRDGRRAECSCIVVALVLREQAVGVLYLDRPESEECFRAEDIALLQALANQVPVALELSRALCERERLQLNLRQAQKMEAIGRLAGGIAHDFNNILATIQFAGDSLAMVMPVDQEGREDLDAIRDSARRGTELTRQLLTFSRDKVVPPRRIILGDVVRGLMPMVRRLVRPEVRVEVDIDPVQLPTMADPTDIERMLLNLCQNASDAIRGSGVISIQVGRASHDPNSSLPADLRPGKAYAQLTVSDTGSGMNDEVRLRLFEPFFTTKAGGTGLGLANVYAIVQRCKGHIDVTSDLDVGSSFRICLPLVGEAAQRAKDLAIAHKSVGLERPDEYTILVVDDDETIRRALTRSLKRAGYHVLSACDGEDALRVVEAYDGLIDVAISDIHMPGMTGSQLMAELLERDSDIKPLFISNDAAPDLVGAGLMPRKAAFLRKPFEEAALLALVETLLRASSFTEPLQRIPSS
jgi:eukaryotic-like serine/threonine-protein kinase